MVAVAKPRGNNGSSNRKKAAKGKRKHNVPSKPSSESVITYIFVALSVLLFAGVVTALRMAWQQAFPAEITLDTSKMDPPDPKIDAFIKEACEVATCHESLTLVGRSLLASKDIEPNERLLEVPRSMQIWDLDALRDRFIRNNLYDARHPRSGNHLSSNAFFAAFIALQLRNVDGKLPQMRPLDPLQLSYLRTLPKYEDLKDHPIIWEEKKLENTLKFGTIGHTAGVWLKEMVNSEYDALVEASEAFNSTITRTDYTVSRINVMTRAYNVGVPGPDEELAGQPWGSDELNTFRFILDHNMVEKDTGCRALIPVADMLNHHPNSNAAYKYNGINPVKGNFTVHSRDGGLPMGSEPMITYGKFSESELFVRYGFVNGDGTSPTDVSLAFHHTPLNLPIEPEFSYLRRGKVTEGIDDYQKNLVRRYLTFDDGYDECVKGPAHDPIASELKRLKVDHLVKISNSIDRWVMRVPPRDAFALPSPTVKEPNSALPPQFEDEQVRPETLDMGSIQATCRIISMIDSDYEGRASEILKQNLNKDDYRPPRGNEALEFRTYFCIARWIGSAMITMSQEGDVNDLYAQARRLNRKEHGTIEWAAMHERLAELQSLHLVGDIIQGIVSTKYADKKHNPPKEYVLRDDPCPTSFTDFLLKK